MKTTFRGSRTWVPLILTTGALLAAAGCGRKEEHTEAEPDKPSVAVQTAELEEQTLPELFSAPGRVQYDLTSDLSAKINSPVAAIYAEEGQKVSRGDLLVLLDGKDLSSGVATARASVGTASEAVSAARKEAAMERETSQARIRQAEAAVQQARANVAIAEAGRKLVMAGSRSQEKEQAQAALASAESSLTLAEAEWKRAERLEAAGAISLRQKDLAKNALDQAKARRDQAALSLSTAQEGARREEITLAEERVLQAKVGVREAEEGLKAAKAAALAVGVRDQAIRLAQGRVSESSAMLNSSRVMLGYTRITAPFSGRVVKRMADPGSLAAPGVPLLTVEGGQARLHASVPERVVNTISKGDPVIVSLDDTPGSRMNLTVSSVLPKSETGTGSFEIRVNLPGEDFRTGTFGRAQFKVGTAKALLLPPKAVWERDGLNFVYRVDGESRASLTLVTLGRKFDQGMEVLSGLKAGDKIITGDLKEVQNGRKVTF